MKLYIDPGTGSMLFAVLIGVVGAAVYSRDLHFLLFLLYFTFDFVVFAGEFAQCIKVGVGIDEIAKSVSCIRHRDQLLFGH